MENNLITVEEFAESSIEERKKYIKERLFLEDLWVVGVIKGHNRGGTGELLIKELANPYTGTFLKSRIFSDSFKKSLVRCKDKSPDDSAFKKDTLVLVKFSISDSINSIRNGKLFEANFDDIYVVEESNEVRKKFEKLKVSIESIKLIYSFKKYLYQGEDISLADLSKEIIDSRIKRDIEMLESKREEIDKDLSYIKDKERYLVETEYSIYSVQEKLESLGINLDKKIEHIEEAENQNVLKVPETFSELLSGVREQLFARGFEYDMDTIRRFMLTLMTGQMMVLSGPSGTGKTSIVKHIADIIGVNYEIIPVQPSWTDKQDLLGFYNPIRKLYTPSAFLDCIVEAQNQKEKLFIVCLDEMNLAQIEYYLADVLSVREVNGEKIRLYSSFEYRQNLNEIKWFANKVLDSDCGDIGKALEKMGIDSIAQYEIAMRYENMERYRDLVEIPSNLRIIGTMNLDGSVRSLSPKIIDRSFIIPIEHQEEKYTSLNPNMGSYNLESGYFSIIDKNDSGISEEVESKIKGVEKELGIWNIEYNNRFEKHISEYCSISSKAEVSENKIMDDILLMKILPRIHEVIEDIASVENLEERLYSYLEDDSSSKRKLEKMKKKYSQTDMYSYWS